MAESAFVVQTLQPGEDGSIHIEGYNLLPEEFGLYAARIVSAQANERAKEIAKVGPSSMAYDRSTHQFQITFEPPAEDVFYAADPKIVELYARKAKIKEIPYG